MASAEKDPYSDSEFDVEDESCKTVWQKIEVIRILLDSSSHVTLALTFDTGETEKSSTEEEVG